MPKDKKKSRVKLIQSVKLDPELADILEKYGVRKPRVVDKLESLEKWIAAKGWRLHLDQGRREMTVATILLDGPDGEMEFTGEGETLALATTVALCDALTNGPRQATIFDVEEDADTPRRDDQPALFDADNMSDDDRARVVEKLTDIRDAMHDHDARLDRSTDREAESADVESSRAESPPAYPAYDDDEPSARDLSNHSFDGDRMLFEVAAVDHELWKKATPAGLRWSDGCADVAAAGDDHTGAPDEEEHEGWYLDYGLAYDLKRGVISGPKRDQIHWTRADQLESDALEQEATAETVRTIERVALIDENHWLTAEPLPIRASSDVSGAWTFAINRGCVYVEAEGKIYDNRARVLWTREFPKLGTADHPMIDVPDLTAELERREHIAWALHEADIYPSLFVDSSTLEYVQPKENIATGQPDDVVLLPALVESAFESAVSEGKIEPSPRLAELAADADGTPDDAAVEELAAALEESGVVEAAIAADRDADEPEQDEFDDADESERELDELVTAAIEGTADAETLNVIAELMDEEFPESETTAGPPDDRIVDPAEIDVALWRDDLPEFMTFYELGAEDNEPEDYFLIPTGWSYFGESGLILRDDEVMWSRERATAAAQARYAAGIGNNPAYFGRDSAPGQSADEDEIAAAEADAAEYDANDARLAAHAGPSCAAWTLDGQCANPAEVTRAPGVMLCGLHERISQDEGRLHLSDHRLLRRTRDNDPDGWEIRTPDYAHADKPPAPALRDAPDIRIPVTPEPAPDSGVSGASEPPADYGLDEALTREIDAQADGDPQRLADELRQMGAVWNANGYPSLPPAGRGRPSKARHELERRFSDVRARYLATFDPAVRLLMERTPEGNAAAKPDPDADTPSGPVVNGGTLPTIGEGTPAVAVEEILS